MSTAAHAAAETERSIRLAVINGILFIAADTLLDPTLVLVAFVARLTDSPLLLGLVLPIHDAAWSLPQLWVSGYLQARPLKITLYRQLSLVRILAWAVLAAVMNLLRDPTALLVSFFLIYTISSLANGFSGLSFLEVVSKTVPPTRRGETFALRFGLGGLLGVAGSLLVRWMIGADSPLPFPNNFGLLAVLFFLLASVSLLIYNTVREQPDSYLPPRRGLRSQLQRAIQVLASEPNYRRLLVTQSLLFLANMATPFFAVFAQQQFGIDPAWVGVYLGVLMATNLLSNLLLGRLSRRVDNQSVLVRAATAGVIMSLLMAVLAIFGRPLGFSPQLAAVWLLPVFVLSGVRYTGMGIASNSLLLNVAPPADRTLVIGFTQSLLGIVMLATGIGGVIVQAAGFITLAVITLACHLAALALSLRISDPARPAH